MGWNNENGKHFSLVCATHDRVLGRTNLTKIGMTIGEAILFEKYIKMTENDVKPVDWPEWLELQTGRIHAAPETELLGLPPQIWNTLRRHGIKTIKELEAMEDKELLRIRTLGPNRVLEIRKCLKELRSGPQSLQ